MSFPLSPIDGDIYNGRVYNATLNSWDYPITNLDEDGNNKIDPQLLSFPYIDYLLNPYDLDNPLTYPASWINFTITSSYHGKTIVLTNTPTIDITLPNNLAITDNISFKVMSEEGHNTVQFLVSGGARLVYNGQAYSTIIVESNAALSFNFNVFTNTWFVEGVGVELSSYSGLRVRSYWNKNTNGSNIFTQAGDVYIYNLTIQNIDNIPITVSSVTSQLLYPDTSTSNVILTFNGGDYSSTTVLNPNEFWLYYVNYTITAGDMSAVLVGQDLFLNTVVLSTVGTFNTTSSLTKEAA